jgi:outer membrane lipoprotein-sorting protein
MHKLQMRACCSAFTFIFAFWLASASTPAWSQAVAAEAPQVAEHPLKPAVDLATRSLQIQDANVRDYSATVRKVERIDGKVGEPEFALVKVRNKPFSVYMHFIGPDNLKGQECVYVEGQNNGNMLAHAPPNTLRGKFGTVSLAPNSAMAMKGQRYPITELGIYNLTRRLVEVGQKDMKFGECDVKFFKDYKVAGRPCTMIQVVHPVPRRNFLFHEARIFVDDQLQMPIRYEAYDWPSQPGGKPELLEEYTYLNLKLNNGYTDADFDVHNPQYQFNMKR